MISIEKDFHFHSAHRLHHLPVGHKCRELHGHTYRLKVKLEAEETSPATAMVIDFGELSKLVENQIVKVFDHAILVAETDQALKEIPQEIGRKVILPIPATTSEELASFIAHTLRDQLLTVPFLRRISVTVCESDTSRAAFTLEVA